MAKWNPRLVGIFVLGGLALATLLVTLLGGGRFFSRKVPFITYFSGSVTGLRVGAPVRFRGIVVGEVTGIYLSLEVDSAAGYVPVSFEIDEQRVRRRGASGVCARGASGGRSARATPIRCRRAARARARGPRRRGARRRGSAKA